MLWKKTRTALSSLLLSGLLAGASRAADVTTHVLGATAQTLSASTDTVKMGYYSATTLHAVDPNLAAGNIKFGVSIFGIPGILTGGVGGVAGTATTADIFSGRTADINADGAAETGTLNLAGNITTFDGIVNLIPNAYDGAGNGTNRWVMTDSGDAVTGDILSGKKAWVDGKEVTGNVPAGANVLGGNGLKTFAIPDGLYSGGKTATANDTNLTAANIKSSVTIFGVTGIIAFPDTGQVTVSVSYDDASYNPDATQLNFTTDAANDIVTDNRTGLIWVYNGTGAHSNNGNPLTWANAVTYCHNLGNFAGAPIGSPLSWRLPNVKELGSIISYRFSSPSITSNFTNTYSNGYWSSTTYVADPTQAWIAVFLGGNIGTATKTNTLYVRCVRTGS